jgi:N4-gp56 family major capsid protein
MAITRFRPEIWAARLLVTLKKSLVYAAPLVVNRDYEGEIRESGDTVKITSISRPTIGTYVPNVTVITPEELTDAQRNLLIDQSKYFSFKVDDVDKRQAKGNVMTEAMSEAAYALRDVADQKVASLYTGVAAANDLGTVSVTTPSQAYDLLVDLGVRLDESNVSSEGRYAVMPPWYHGMLQKDPRFTSVADSGTSATLRNGMVGEAAGFSIRKSNNAPNPTGDDYIVQAGHPMAISYAEQIVQTEAYRPESSFSDAIKGLHVYGTKLIRPEAIAILRASKT